MHTVFSIEESLKFGWQKTKTHSMLLFQVLLTLFALNVVSSIVQNSLKDTAIGTLASLALLVAGIILGIGFLNISLKIAKGEAAVYRDIVPKAKVVWEVFLASLIAGIITVVGLIFLVIPGIYFALRFSMVRFAVLEGSSVMDSFGTSTKLTDGSKLKLLGFIIVICLLNILGAIALLVGLLITIPTTMIAFTHVYLKLKAHAHEHNHSH